jgi:hypothetical protein
MALLEPGVVKAMKLAPEVIENLGPVMVRLERVSWRYNGLWRSYSGRNVNFIFGLYQPVGIEFMNFSEKNTAEDELKW